jgi:hypothetical protein
MWPNLTKPENLHENLSVNKAKSCPVEQFELEIWDDSRILWRSFLFSFFPKGFIHEA